ncbi:MAG TPA: septum formation initiator family protein [Bacteroidales bacterium]|nr:septum formation initiator family protein [Bacteroidales bacterium]
MIKRIPKIFKNKYFLVLIAFLVWMIFFDTNSWIQQIKLNRELREVKAQQEFYLNEYRTDSIWLHQLETDYKSMEKLAREKYLMVGDGEKFFIVVEEDSE